LFFLFRATTRQRVVLLGLAPIAVVILAVFVPHQTWRHIRSFSATSADADIEAIESSETRQYTLRKSIEYTLQHPIVGVGPGEFAWYEGLNNRYGGTTHGFWHETHNTFTEVSSECGIPGLIFFLFGIISTFRLANATYRQARSRPECKDIAVAAFCIMLAMASFVTAITFLSFAYLFYLPTLAGLAIALERTAQAEFSSRDALASEPQQPPWGGVTNGFQTGAGRIPARQAVS
jgi:O-antigen ligase